MIDTKSIISTVIGSTFIITICIAPAISVAESSQSLDKSLMLAQAHEHDQEKGRGQGGGHKEREDKEGHGKEGKSDKHGGKKDDGMKKDGHDYAHMVIFHTDTLKLSDEQLGKIVRLHLKYKQGHELLKKKLKKSMKAFKNGSMKPGTSDDQLHKLGKDHTNAFNTMVEHHVMERHAIHAVLSNDQKKQLDTMKMNHDNHDDDHSHH